MKWMKYAFSSGLVFSMCSDPILEQDKCSPYLMQNPMTSSSKYFLTGAPPQKHLLHFETFILHSMHKMRSLVPYHFLAKSII
ncbi:hypothetical protein FKM82_004440 [Ascaphus truei]